MTLLRILAESQGKSIVEVMEPHKDVLADMIPPKKHLLRHQAANAQVGLMEGNTFCTTLNPRLFTIGKPKFVPLNPRTQPVSTCISFVPDLSIPEHKVFYIEVQTLCDAEDAALHKLPCFKNVTSLLPLRKAALRALAACHYLEGDREKIFAVLFKAMDWPRPELQEAAFECMQSFVAGFQIDMEMVSIVYGLLRFLECLKESVLMGNLCYRFIT